MNGPFGAILAGGESRRYGSPKALASVGGERIVDRVVAALRNVVPDVIVSANEAGMLADLGLPTYPDERPGAGALGGIHAVLRQAKAAGRPGVLAVACDMPFPCVPLLERLRDEAFGATAGAVGFGPVGRTAAGTAGETKYARDAGDAGRTDRTARPDVVIPESRGRRGTEPLFAAYGVGCLPAIEARLAAGDHRMISFHGDVRVLRIPLSEVAALCDLDRAFLNVNTPGERDRAERLAGDVG